MGNQCPWENAINRFGAWTKNERKVQSRNEWQYQWDVRANNGSGKKEGPRPGWIEILRAKGPRLLGNELSLHYDDDENRSQKCPLHVVSAMEVTSASGTPLCCQLAWISQMSGIWRLIHSGGNLCKGSHLQSVVTLVLRVSRCIGLTVFVETYQLHFLFRVRFIWCPASGSVTDL